MQPSSSRRFSQALAETIQNMPGEQIAFGSLAKGLGYRTYGLLLVLLSLPNAIPISGFIGLSTLTAFLMLILAVQLSVLIESPWMPKFIAKRHIAKASLLKALNVVTPYIQKIEPLIKPRWAFLDEPWALHFIGVLTAVFCLVMVLPIPFSNFGPALAMFLIGLGMLERDGVFVTAGLIFGSIYCVGFVVLMFEAIVKFWEVAF